MRQPPPILDPQQKQCFTVDDRGTRIEHGVGHDREVIDREDGVRLVPREAVVWVRALLPTGLMR